MESRKAAAALAPWLVLLLCAAPLAYRLFYPFVTMADNNSAAFAQPARNYLRHGPIATRMGMAYNMGEALPARFAYNSHHPPLAAAGAAAAFLILGVSDWSSRLYPAACSIGSALVLFALWRRHRGPGPAALAAVVMATLPAFGHFGKMLGEEAPTLFFGLLTILLFERWADASARAGRAAAAGCLAAYAAGCLSGWAAFYLGPILMGVALATLPRGPARRRGVAGVALTGLIAFAIVAGHVAFLTGSPATLLDAARGRALTGAADFDVTASGRDSWLRREAVHFGRLYGAEAALLALVGGLGPAIAARRRPAARTVITLASLLGFGLAHPLIFRWAAYVHDWLLFHLLPIVAIGVAEGILLLASAASWVVQTARAPASAGRVAAAVVIAAGLAHRATVGARELESLALEQPRYAWALLGRRIAQLTPGRSHVMANFPFLEAPLRFYADRPSATVVTADRFETTLTLHDHALYIRDMNIPIDADLERLLDGREWEDLASYRLYRIGGDGALGTMPPASEADPRQSQTFALDARFADSLQLVDCAMSWPGGGEGVRPTAAYLGLFDPTEGRPRIVSVTSSWRALNGVPPRWRLFVAMPAEPESSGPALPLVQLAAAGSLDLDRWRDRREFTVKSAFLIAEAAGASDYTVRFAISDGGNPVTPRVPGPPRPQLKSAVVGPISVPGRGP